MFMDLVNVNGRQMFFATVPSVEVGRKLWTRIACFVEVELCGFRIYDEDGTTLYTGNYVSDEC